MSTEINEAAQPIARGILGTLQLTEAMPPITKQPMKLQPVKGNVFFGAVLAFSLTLAIFWACGAFLNSIDPPAHTPTLSERVADLESPQEQDAADHQEAIDQLQQDVQDAQAAADQAQDTADENARVSEERRFDAEQEAEARRFSAKEQADIDRWAASR